MSQTLEDFGLPWFLFCFVFSPKIRFDCCYIFQNCAVKDDF